MIDNNERKFKKNNKGTDTDYRVHIITIQKKGWNEKIQKKSN